MVFVMKILLIGLGVLIIQLVFLFSSPARTLSLNKLNESIFIENNEKLNQLSTELNKLTNADHVWLWLFHENIDQMYSDTDIFNFSLRFNFKPLYISSPYMWHKPNIKITKNTTNIDLSSFPDMNRTFNNECLSRISNVRDSKIFETVQLGSLVIRCPLYDDNENIIGLFGITILDYDISTYSADNQNLISAVSLYEKQFRRILYPD